MPWAYQWEQTQPLARQWAINWCSWVQERPSFHEGPVNIQMPPFLIWVHLNSISPPLQIVNEKGGTLPWCTTVTVHYTLLRNSSKFQYSVNFKLVVSDSLQNKLIGVCQSLLQILCANILCSHYFTILFIITNIIFWYIKSQPQSFLLAAQN